MIHWLLICVFENQKHWFDLPAWLPTAALVTPNSWHKAGISFVTLGTGLRLNKLWTGVRDCCVLPVSRVWSYFFPCLSLTVSGCTRVACSSLHLKPASQPQCLLKMATPSPLLPPTNTRARGTDPGWVPRAQLLMGCVFGFTTQCFFLHPFPHGLFLWRLPEEMSQLVFSPQVCFCLKAPCVQTRLWFWRGVLRASLFTQASADLSHSRKMFEASSWE